MHIDDGYTEVHGEYSIRRMLLRERQEFRRALTERTFFAQEMLSRRVQREGFYDGVPVNLMPREIAEIVVHNPSEAEDLENLKSGMQLMLADPLLAIRPCSLCQKWWFDQETGKVVNIGGQNIRRPKHSLPACRTEAGCGKGTPENSRAFSERNQKAFEHWREWRSVGCPAPQDGIVRRNWMVFETLVEKHGLRRIRKAVSR